MAAYADVAVRFLEWLSYETLEVSLLGGLILLILLTLGRFMSPRWRYALWMVLVLRMLIPWLPASPWSLYRVLPDGARQVSPFETPREPITQARNASPAAHRTRDTAPTGLGTGERHAWYDAARATWLWWVVGAWGFGVLALVLCTQWEYRRLWRGVRGERAVTNSAVLDLLENCRAQLAIPTMVGINVTGLVQTPTLLGFLRPRLLLPKSMAASLSMRQLRHIFLHELAHLKRHDIAVNWLMTLCQIVHWFNPLVWLALYLARGDREMACDRIALRQLEAKPPQEYGRTLIRMIEHCSHMKRLTALAGLAQDRYQLKRRLRGIVKCPSKGNGWEAWPALVMALLLATGLTSAPSPSPPSVGTSSVPSQINAASMEAEVSPLPMSPVQVEPGQGIEAPVSPATAEDRDDRTEEAGGIAPASHPVEVPSEAGERGGVAYAYAQSGFNGGEGVTFVDANAFAISMRTGPGSRDEVIRYIPPPSDWLLFVEQTEQVLVQTARLLQQADRPLLRQRSLIPIGRLAALFTALAAGFEGEHGDDGQAAGASNVMERFQQQRIQDLHRSLPLTLNDVSAVETAARYALNLKKQTDLFYHGVTRMSEEQTVQAFRDIIREWRQLVTLLPTE